jgi:hypothetical protein
VFPFFFQKAETTEKTSSKDEDYCSKPFHASFHEHLKEAITTLKKPEFDFKWTLLGHKAKINGRRDWGLELSALTIFY